MSLHKRAMRVFIMRKRYLIFIGLIFIAGCVGPKNEKLAICPGRVSVQESISVLNEQAKQARSFRAGGQCFATVHEKEKKHKEEFAVKLWFNPPGEVRLFGDVAFNARGLDIGCNESEFWFAARPKELGNYFLWGKWNEQQNSYARLGPKLLVDAFGGIDFEKPELLSLSHEAPFDILTELSEGKIVRKIYIYCCDYRVRKIEYFDEAGKAAVVLEMSNYRKALNGSLFPGELKLRSLRNDGREDVMRVVFGVVKGYEYTRLRRGDFFGMPTELGGFGKIYKVVDGQMIEQEQ
jgi:hypothetical protein